MVLSQRAGLRFISPSSPLYSELLRPGAVRTESVVLSKTNTGLALMETPGPTCFCPDNAVAARETAEFAGTLFLQPISTPCLPGCLGVCFLSPELI